MNTIARTKPPDHRQTEHPHAIPLERRDGDALFTTKPHDVQPLIMDKNQSLKVLGLDNLGQVFWDLSTPALYEGAIRRHEGGEVREGELPPDGHDLDREVRGRVVECVA